MSLYYEYLYDMYIFVYLACYINGISKNIYLKSRDLVFELRKKIADNSTAYDRIAFSN